MTYFNIASEFFNTIRTLIKMRVGYSLLGTELYTLFFSCETSSNKQTNFVPISITQPFFELEAQNFHQKLYLKN